MRFFLPLPQEKAKETREKVKLLLQLADTLVEKGHAHAPSIKTWVQDVDSTYKDFSTRMDAYRIKLEQTLGIQTQVNVKMSELSLDRNSDSSLEAKMSSSSSSKGGGGGGGDRSSISSSGSGGSHALAGGVEVTGDLKQIKEMNEEKRRSARRKE